MIKIGITGQAGFVGTHLFHLLGLKEGVKRVPFEDDVFEDQEKLQAFVKSCDVIVHLAAMNRHQDPKMIYNTNIRLVTQLIEAMEKTNARPHVIFSSSTQEERNNLYGKSKQEGRELFIDWATRNKAGFTGLIIPNVFGPFGKPFYNSVVATFCYQLTHHESPKIEQDALVKLIYVEELTAVIWQVMFKKQPGITKQYLVPFTSEVYVSDLLKKLQQFQSGYFDRHIFPELQTPFDIHLFNTFRSYIDHKSRFPVIYTLHSDNRGSFAETVKTGSGGQFSFSTTKPGITRGDHFHTRKIERFAVIKGEAIIKLRRIGTDEVLSFRLSGEAPSFVDMPVWYTHNITNVGKEELYTLFWINEFFNPDDPDTFYEEV